ncbi:MAG: DUF5317 family protein [Acidimicrobiales bacterium]
MRRAEDIRLRLVWVLAIALTMQAMLPFTRTTLGAHAGTSLLVVSYMLVGLWVAINARHSQRLLRLGFAAVAVGWLLNLLAIAPNEAMPVSRLAAQAASEDVGMSHTNVPLAKHVRADESHVMRQLGDVIPGPPLRLVVSIGDLFLLLGVALVVAGAMHAADERRGARSGTCIAA